MRVARFLARRTDGELVVLASLATASLAGVVLLVPNMCSQELLVIGFALALVVARRLDLRRRRSA